uniref:Uncharacterized protein n=1 Tax=Rhizophora mucronata TaxID=61149 RepID=A0A2P2IMH6_RHIMU
MAILELEVYPLQQTPRFANC